jgi:hypothetical protein
MMGVDLTDVADELYAVPPEEFTAARTAARDRARADGDKELAKAIAALPKPTTAAWVGNLLARRKPDEVGQLVELGELLRQAQANLSGEQLRELGRQRNQVVAALTRQARALAHQEGYDVSTSVAEQVEETLRAAIADRDAGAALREGRLTSSLRYTGIGPVDLDGAVATPLRAAAPAAPARPRKQAGQDAAAREEAEERRRREEAERRRREAEQARRDAEEAAARARDAAAAAEAAEQQLAAAAEKRDRLRARVEELTEELQRVERQVSTASGDVHTAEKHRDAAARRSATAAAISERAAARAERLADGG